VEVDLDVHPEASVVTPNREWGTVTLRAPSGTLRIQRLCHDEKVPEFSITDIHDEAAEAELRDQLVIHNIESTGYGEYRALNCFLRSPEGELQAGISGFSWGGYAMIEWLWVSPSLRGAGLCGQLLQALESEVRARSCRVIRVNTHTFQAPDFYRMFGYERIGYAEDTPIGHGEAFFAKRLP
jgi:ribosomal protein S18 acetylase RimI-like enzyme